MILLGALIVLDRVGAATAPWMATHHPLALVGLDPSEKSVLLAVRASTGLVVALAVFRRLAGQVLYFYLGRHLGPEARRWLDRQGAGRVMGLIERAFRRAAYPVLFVAPRDVVCLLAGDAGLRLGPVAAVVFLRDVASVLVARMLSEALAGPITRVLDAINRYVWPLTVAGVAVAVILTVRARRRGPVAAPPTAPAPLAPEGDQSVPPAPLRSS